MTAIRIALVSDIHREWDKTLVFPDLSGKADILLAAGDIDNGVDAIAFLEGARIPTFKVPGNHTFWGGERSEILMRLRARAAESPTVRLLDMDRAEIEVRGRRITVLGATLWTDYALHGNAPLAMTVAAGAINDHRKIEERGESFMPHHAAALHAEARAWLESELSRSTPADTIVVTHHAPCELSLDDGRVRDRIAPAYASRLEGLMAEHAPALWAHGHTHHDVDYRVYDTRVVACQNGYPGSGRPLKIGFFDL